MTLIEHTIRKQFSGPHNTAIRSLLRAHIAHGDDPSSIEKIFALTPLGKEKLRIVQEAVNADRRQS